MPPVTHPPRIVLESVQPAETVILTQRECESLQLRLSVADEDTDQTILAHWFVDFKSPQNEAFVEVTIPPAANSTLLRQVEPFIVNPRGQLTVGHHTVDVIVADEFNAGSPRSAKGKEGTGLSAIYRWVIEVEEGVCGG